MFGFRRYGVGGLEGFDESVRVLRCTGVRYLSAAQRVHKRARVIVVIFTLAIVVGN